MAKYPLIYGNTITDFNLDSDGNGTPRNPSDSSFDVYVYKNTNDSKSRAYAVITLKNTGAGGIALNFSNIRLKDANGVYYTDSYSGYKINPVDNSGNIYIGQEDGIADGSGNKTIAQGSEEMGTDGVDDDASSRWLRVTSTGDLEDSDTNLEGSVDLGVTASFRVVPLYTISALTLNNLPSNSWAAFVLEFAPSEEGDGLPTDLVINSNAGEFVIPLEGEAFNDVIIGMQQGLINSGSNEFQQSTTVENGTSLSLGYKGIVENYNSDLDYPVVKLFDTSDTNIPEDFSWTNDTYQSTAGNYIADGTTYNAPVDHRFVSLHNSYCLQGAGWTTSIDSLSGANNNHQFDGSSNLPLYKKFNIPGGDMSGGTLVATHPSHENYLKSQFAIYQWNTVYHTLASGGTESFTYAVRTGVYPRLTLPKQQWQSAYPYNRITEATLLTGPILDTVGGAAIAEGNTASASIKVPLSINLRFNNWAGDSSGADSGEYTEFSDNLGFRLFGSRFNVTGVVGYRTDNVNEEPYTSPLTSSFTAFTNAGDYKDCSFRYDVRPNITFLDYYGYSSDDNNCKAEDITPFGVIEGYMYPQAANLQWKGITDYPHMASAGDNTYKLAYWPKRDILTMYPKSASNYNIFHTDEACPGYPSGTGLTESESGGIDKKFVSQWYNATGGDIDNVPEANFTTNNTNVTHADTEVVSNVYSGDGGKIYSNNNHAYTNSGGSLQGFSSFVDVLGVETGFTSYNTNRIFHGGNAYKKHIRTKLSATVPEFYPNDYIYDLGMAQLNPTDGEYRAHGIFKLGNTGQGLTWLHSIHTEKAYIYEIDVSDANNNMNSKANYGYMPNADSTSAPAAGPKLEFFTEAGTSNINADNWVSQKAYYTDNADGSTLSDSASSYDNEIGKYYTSVAGTKAHFILPDWGADDGDYLSSPNYTNLPDLHYNSSNLMTYSGVRASGGGDIYVRMSVPSQSDADDLGEYRMALKVTYMVHDWGNTKYRKEVGGEYISTSHNANVDANAAENSLASENQQALRLIEATFIFRMTVDVEAVLEVTDQEGDLATNNIDFGTINIG